MIDDYTLRQLNNLMRTLGTPGLKDALRAAVEHRKAIDAMGGLSVARGILEQHKLMNGYLEAAKVSAQMSNAILSLGSAARTISGSIFGSVAMSSIAAMGKEQAHLMETVSSAVSKMDEFNRISAAEISRMAKIGESAGRVADWYRQIAELSKTIKGFDLASLPSHFGSIGRITEAAETSMRLVR